MRSCMRFILMASIVAAAAITPRAQAPTFTYSGTETRVTSDPGDQYDPSISGNLVVFTDDRSGDQDVYYVDLTTLQEYPVIVAPGDQELTSVSGSRIAYTDYRSVDVVVYDIVTGVSTNVTGPDKTAAGFNSIDPAISGSLVAWEDDRNGDPEIYAKNLDTNEERRVSVASDSVDERPAISGNVIVWEHCPYAGGNCDIWSYDWSTGVTLQITNTPDVDERHPSVDGHWVVYQCTACGENGDQDVYAYDTATLKAVQLSLPGDQANPHVSGDNVSIDDLSSGTYHIKLWHIPSNQVFDVTSGTAGQYLNDIDGNRIVYTDDRNGDLDIYMTEFTLTASDSTPPVITPHVTGTAGNGGWYIGAATTVTWNVSDPESGIASQSGCDPTTLTADTPGTTLTCTATNGAGLTASKSITIAIDHTPPAIVPPPSQTVGQTQAGGASVTYPAPAIVETGSGLASASCVPPSGTLFAPGTTTVTCTATDVAGNSSAAQFLVTVTASAAGRMLGAGWIDGERQDHFIFQVAQWDNRDYGQLVYWETDYSRAHRTVGRFESTAVTSAVFSDDPAFQPGHGPLPTVDTVVFTGVGRWNGRAGYSFEARATDQGEPGRLRDTFRIVVSDAAGLVVASVDAPIDGGNIQSTRVCR